MAAFFMDDFDSPMKPDQPDQPHQPDAAAEPKNTMLPVAEPSVQAATVAATVAEPGAQAAQGAATTPIGPCQEVPLVAGRGKQVRGKDKVQRQERHTQSTFAGRRPPKNADGQRFFFSLKESYLKVKEVNPSSTQTEYWTFMMQQLKGKERNESNMEEASRLFMRRHRPSLS